VNHFQSLRDYEAFIYTIQLRYPTVMRSTLVVVRRGAELANLRGELIFHGRIRLVIWERITLEDEPLRIETYGYEIWRGVEKLYWYDSQAHPNHPDLAATHPHHKHIPPDIKHHRAQRAPAAPSLRFTQPNLPFLIQEIEQRLPPSTAQAL